MVVDVQGSGRLTPGVSVLPRAEFQAILLSETTESFYGLRSQLEDEYDHLPRGNRDGPGGFDFLPFRWYDRYGGLDILYKPGRSSDRAAP